MAVKGKAADMQPIPKGKPEKKPDPKKAARQRKADAVKAKLPEPHQYVAKLVNGIVHELKTTGKSGWGSLKEREQKSLIGLFQNQCEKVVREMLLDLAGQGVPTIGVKLTGMKMKEKGGADFSLSTPTVTKACHMASEKMGRTFVLVLMDPSVYMSGEMPEADKDQPDLNLPQPEHKAHEPFADDDGDEAGDEDGDDE